jgi:hypothetical protein
MTGRALYRRLAWVLLAAAVVTGALVVFGIEHEPDYAFSLFGSPANAFNLKSKVATVILGLALLQLLLALWMSGFRVRGPHDFRFVECTGSSGSSCFWLHCP